MRHYQSATETLVKVRASLAISIGLSPLIERSAGDKESLMANIDAHVVKFQCPSCGHDLEQSIGRLKVWWTHAMSWLRHWHWHQHRHEPLGQRRGGNGPKALEKVPPEITIKFYR